MFVTARLANFYPFSLCSWHVNDSNEFRMWNKNLFHCHLIWASRHSNSSTLSQTALLFLAMTWWHGMDSFIPSIIKQTIPLSNSPFSSESISSPPKYSSHSCKYISSNKRQIFSDILPSFFKVWAYLKASIFYLTNLLNKGKDGMGKSFNNIL